MAGIIDTIKLAGTLVFALPAAVLGLEFLVGDRPLVGAALVGLAVGLVVLQEYLTLPTDLPGMAVKRVFGTVAKEPDDEQK